MLSFTPSQAANTSFDDPSGPQLHPGQSGADDDEPGKFSADYVSSVDYLSDSSNYSPEKEEARARWFYEVTRRERDWELEDSERELYCKVQQELFEDAPSNAFWDLRGVNGCTR